MENDFDVFLNREIVARVNGTNDGPIIDACTIDSVVPFNGGLLFYLENGGIAIMHKNPMGLKVYNVSDLKYKIEGKENKINPYLL